MKKKEQARFDIDTLRELAGDKVFARGEAYYRDGQVEILLIEPKRVLAQVSGTEDHRTELAGRSKKIDGECSCPAFTDWGFCKHMVATALAVNAVSGEAEAEDAGALARIRNHLKEQGIDALVEMILGLAEQDLTFFRKLDMAAVAAKSDDKTLEKRLRKSLDNATRTEGYIAYREAGGWAAGVDVALDAIAGLVPAGRAEMALRLAGRALDRIENAIESIDDSDGHCGGLLERVSEIHLKAASAARPEPVAFARTLFAREMKDDYGTFYGAVAPYAGLLGEQGLAEYRRLAMEAWGKLPPGSAGKRAARELPEGFHRLIETLDFFAERDGDVETRIALRAKDLSSPWSYLQLAKFCLEQGREQEALRHAEEGLWMFEDERPDQRLVFFVVDLLVKAGRKSDAETRLWRAFEKQPSLDLYDRLRKLGGKAAARRVIAFLNGRLGNKEHIGWYTPAGLLIRVLMHEKMFDDAWKVVNKSRVSLGLGQELAQASEATHPREALEIYAKCVDHFAELGGNSSYAEVVQLIARMAKLRPKTKQAAYVAAIKARFHRKRNLMKMLA